MSKFSQPSIFCGKKELNYFSLVFTQENTLYFYFYLFLESIIFSHISTRYVDMVDYWDAFAY